ncbi:uncharacterized protein DUF1194 [Rhizobium subbaraonis]|uniref:Uncharacterized protein DUF1194 n=1 Tax=Rhizobium subbaraonis TaxID=908946 RepID=A0A285TZZ9_9HYPH|nr:DUF1194 domain-containing protein [Rhizobium subbaraonis]SOC35300.1 uncharacterized protein DUF1194 [Rhizobium subbaraonis]
MRAPFAHLPALGCALLLSAAAPISRAGSCIDLALVLAVDGSGSISDAEFAFQQGAISAALRAPDVRRAMQEAGVVAIGAVFWGDGEFPVQVLGWDVVVRGNGAEALASRIENTPRLVFGNTDIGNGLWSALDMLSAPNMCAVRRVVNVSGDGMESITRKRRRVASLPAARERARTMGVTVNALTVSDDVPDLASYYAASVIAGRGAFVMDVRSNGDFAAAIKRKLIREVSPQSVASLGHGGR